MTHAKWFPAVALTLGLAACASIPTGPTVAVMPGPGKPFEVFQTDNLVCREYARQQIGVNPNEASSQQVVSGAAAGAVIGAAAGVMMGGRHDNAVGSTAAAGMLMGSAIGAGSASETRWTLQQRYNIAYMQCMYAKGNQVPGYAPPQYTPPPPPPNK